MALTKITPQMFDTSATAHDLNVDNGTFVVDGSASRVGIGTATPSTLLDVNGALTAGSIAVDNITIDGNEIDASSGHIVLDSADEIKLDSHSGIIRVQTQGGDIGMIRALNNDLQIRSMVADKNLIFKGNDGGSVITALTLDMQNAGTAIFNSNISGGGHLNLPDNGALRLGADNDLEIYHDGSNTYIDNKASGPELLLRDANAIILRKYGTSDNMIHCAGGGAVSLYHNGGLKLQTSSTGVTVTGNIVIGDNAYIGTTSSTTAMQIAAAGGVTFASSVKLSGQSSSDGLRLDLAGSTDYKIGETSTNDIVSFGAAGGAATHLIHHNISSGHVGIGNSSPSAPLDVVTNSTVWAGEFTQSNTSNGDGVIVTVGSTASADYALSIRSDAGNTGAFNVKADGKVGVGTFAPPHKFSVFGTGAGNATVQIEGEGGADPYINFLANNTQHWSVGIDDSDDDKFKISKHSALGTNDYFTINTAGATTLSSSGGSAGFLYLNYVRGISDGNTGINIAGSDVLGLQTGGAEQVLINSTGLIINDSSLIFDKPSVYGFRFLHNDAGNDLSLQIGDANNANYRSLANFDTNGLNVNYTNNNSNMARLRLGRNVLNDAYVFFNSGAGAGDWSLGTDYSDSSKFKLSRYSSPGGGNNIFEVGTTGDMNFTVHLVPGTTNTYDLGTSTVRWRNIFSQDLHLSNEDTGGNDVDGTEGNWTIQEGEEHLYIINNKTGKKFRFALEEVT